jgi:hypothetical protein
MRVPVVLAQLIMYIGVPLITLWGWTRWTRSSRVRTLSAILSLIGLTFGTASVILAILSLAYAHARGGFPYYDPLLLKIYGTGGLFSFLALGFSIGGLWRPNCVRWQATVCAIGTLFFWFASAMGE